MWNVLLCVFTVAICIDIFFNFLEMGVYSEKTKKQNKKSKDPEELNKEVTETSGRELYHFIGDLKEDLISPLANECKILRKYLKYLNYESLYHLIPAWYYQQTKSLLEQYIEIKRIEKVNPKLIHKETLHEIEQNIADIIKIFGRKIKEYTQSKINHIQCEIAAVSAKMQIDGMIDSPFEAKERIKPQKSKKSTKK